MAEWREPELTADGDISDSSDSSAIDVDISEWTNSQDLESRRKRFKIIYAIIHDFEIIDINRSKYNLRTILNSGWDVNEIILQNCYWYKSTALQEAVRLGCTEAVKMLLEAGATYKRIVGLPNPLVDAIEYCSTDVVRLLLKHGVHPNDHDVEAVEKIPLLFAVSFCGRDKAYVTEVVKLLLEHGANANVTGSYFGGLCGTLNGVIEGAHDDISIALMKTLLQFGADINLKVDGQLPLPHQMIQDFSEGGQSLVLDQLDLFFLHGGNISVESWNYGTALEYAVRIPASKNKNTIRWLIRHGADTPLIAVEMLKGYFKAKTQHFSETPLFLLQAGMRFPHGVQKQLCDVATAFSDALNDDYWIEDMNVAIHGMIKWIEKSEKDRDEELQRMQCNPRKCNFPEYWSRQMADLQEFTDESLQVYPDYDHVDHGNGQKEAWRHILYNMNRVLEFLSQPQSLQWYCRRCVRENLVSLQPSVVKTLPGPARMKRYILCHEI